MRGRYAFLLLFFLLRAAGASAQLTISGTVGDTFNHTSLRRASVSLIRAQDSVLTTFTRSDSAGGYQLRADTGKYILLITYPGFADYVESLDVASDLAMPPVSLISRTHVLQEFVLKKKAAAVVIKGDTTEYAADSFATRSGATVEELLKKLPGLQVDKDGKVTAQGETVQKILVDGEEFFSDDPAVVTKNLQAATVDKVQVYDKKSDQAAFTGIDDGEKTKTINLTLKEDKKRGLFGKATAGGGPSLSPGQNSGFFENQAMVNLFRGKQQIAAFGIMSNTGTVGLGWSDRDKYGSGSGNREYDEENGFMYYSGSNDPDDLSASWDSKYNGEGLPAVWTGGLHYANKWAKDAQHLSANYRYSKNNIEAEGNTTTQYILPDSQYVREGRRSTFATSDRHGGDGLYEWTIDTSSTLKFSLSGNVADRASNGVYATTTKGASGGLINGSNRFSSSASSSQTVAAALVYRKKFAKKGRNTSAEIRLNDRASDGTGYLQSRNDYYAGGTADSINQRKTNTGENFSLNARLSYTEPLSKVTFLTLRYGANLSNSLSERLSFNRAGAEWSTTPDSLYSSSYGYDVLTQNGAAALRFVYKKYNFSLGAEVFRTSWQQHDRLFHLYDRSRDYNNFAPTASLKYSFTKQSNLNLYYSGRTSQPSLEQLQPLLQNTDPLNISIGNPDLRQEFRNDFNASYHSFKPISGRYIYIGSGGSVTQDDIVRAEFFDSLGRHTYQYVNVSGNWNAYFWGNYNFKLKGPDLKIGFSSNLNFARAATFVNGGRNTSRNNNYGLEISIDKDWRKKDKEVAGISINPGINYYDNRASISAFTSSYWQAEISAEAYTELPWKLQIKTEAWWAIREKTEVFTANNNVIRWNASLSRKFLKGDKLELRAAVSDILNQNIGYRRDAQAAYITEDRYNTIRRHAIFSLTYLFSGGAGVVKNDDDDDD